MNIYVINGNVAEAFWYGLRDQTKDIALSQQVFNANVAEAVWSELRRDQKMLPKWRIGQNKEVKNGKPL